MIDRWLKSQNLNSINKKEICSVKKMNYLGSTSLDKKQTRMHSCPAHYLASYLHLFVVKTIFRLNDQSNFFSTFSVQPGQGQDMHDNGLVAYSGTLVIRNTSERKNNSKRG